ncbi:DUF362 domain-containing protein [Candidatus Bathyarchaeota archaeon]|nr:DUF362 domain-containing protein [Candidatus Bathyarchaeota archaeon]
MNEDGALTSKVAIIEFNGDPAGPLKQVLDMIGIDDLNTAERSVVVKVGVFSHIAENHTSIDVVNAITSCFDKTQKVFLAESDNYRGTGLERLQIWKELFTEKIVPFNLSEDSDTKRVKLADEEMNLSHILFKPNVLIDTHILRSFKSGSILKNLFGCIPTSKKAKYHKILPTLLAEVYEVIGGVDLAVLDGTYFWRGAGNAPAQMNTLLAGRDAVAVETVGATLAGLNPQKMPIIQEFVTRGLGEGNLRNIKIVGASFERLKEKFVAAAADQKKSLAKSKGPQTWGGHSYQVLESLIREGFFKLPNKRTVEDVAKAFEAKGLSTKGNKGKIASSLARRVKKGVLKKSKLSNQWVYWSE